MYIERKREREINKQKKEIDRNGTLLEKCFFFHFLSKRIIKSFLSVKHGQ
jgi:hypothetical protein